MRAGEIKNFTGIDSAYEVPIKPGIRVINYQQPLSQTVAVIVNYLRDNNYV